MAKNFSEIQLKKPDDFQSTFGRWLGILIQHRTQALILLGALVLLSFMTIYWNAEREKSNEVAAQKLETVLATFPKSAEDRESWGKFLTSLDTFLDANKDRSVVPAAKLYRGKALLRLGRFQDAVDTYQEAKKALPIPTRYLAMEGEALALMELKRWSDAEAIWLRLSKTKDNPTQALHLWNLGLTQELAKRIEPALTTYKEFEVTYPNSNLIEQVRERIMVLRSTTP